MSVFVIANDSINRSGRLQTQHTNTQVHNNMYDKLITYVCRRGDGGRGDGGRGERGRRWEGGGGKEGDI